MAEVAANTPLNILAVKSPVISLQVQDIVQLIIGIFSTFNNILELVAVGASVITSAMVDTDRKSKKSSYVYSWREKGISSIACPSMEKCKKATVPSVTNTFEGNESKIGSVGGDEKIKDSTAL